jgi:hypothetical protein
VARARAPADVYLRAGSAGDTAFLAPGEQRAIAAIPGIARIAFLRAQNVLLDPARPRVALLARDLRPTTRDPRCLSSASRTSRRSAILRPRG